MERTVFFSFVCFTLAIHLSTRFGSVQQRALAVEFEEVLFRQLYAANFNDKMVGWVVLTIERTALH